MLNHLLEEGRFALGFFLGFIISLISLLFFDYFEVIPLKDSSFTGAVIGALIAGLIAVTGQLLVIESNRYFRDLREIDIDEKLLLSLFQSCQDIGSNLKMYKKHVDDCVNSYPEFDVPKIYSVKPTAGKGFVPMLSREEKLYPLRMKNIEIYQKLAILDYRNSSLVENFSFLQEGRQRLLDVSDLVNDGAGGLRVSCKEGFEEEVQGRIMTLTKNLNEIHSHLIRDVDDVEEIMEWIFHELREKVDPELKLASVN